MKVERSALLLKQAPEIVSTDPSQKPKKTHPKIKEPVFQRRNLLTSVLTLNLSIADPGGSIAVDGVRQGQVEATLYLCASRLRSDLSVEIPSSAAWNPHRSDVDLR
jgi:hypothetical protein